ncbi:hypothetical protein QJS10_CPB13g01249 [Acorus calamus]|uniref:Uncharacterized protein n=1 Tax=Acorus calamus TaxID=4465 RepID=A0AAV9DIE5_ACOCL|nr:hypothetical protein QJS10_CPB13g01249 [Acorus calamus]
MLNLNDLHIEGRQDGGGLPANTGDGSPGTLASQIQDLMRAMESSQENLLVRLQGSMQQMIEASMQQFHTNGHQHQPVQEGVQQPAPAQPHPSAVNTEVLEGSTSSSNQSNGTDGVRTLRGRVVGLMKNRGTYVLLTESVPPGGKLHEGKRSRSGQPCMKYPKDINATLRPVNRPGEQPRHTLHSEVLRILSREMEEHAIRGFVSPFCAKILRERLPYSHGFSEWPAIQKRSQGITYQAPPYDLQDLIGHVEKYTKVEESRLLKKAVATPKSSPTVASPSSSSKRAQDSRPRDQRGETGKKPGA